MAFGSSSRGGQRIIWVAVHTAEGATTASSLRNFFDGNSNASCHTIIDAGSTLDIVPRSRAAWTLRNGNSRSVNAELCAFAKWSRAQWLSSGTVNGCRNPRVIVSRTAAWVRRECVASGVPMVKLTAADVRAGRSGVIGHVDYTNGTGDGSHWDPGPNFPWDIVMAEVRQGSNATTEDDMPLSNADIKRINDDWDNRHPLLTRDDLRDGFWNCNIPAGFPDDKGNFGAQVAKDVLGRLEFRVDRLLGGVESRLNQRIADLESKLGGSA